MTDREMLDRLTRALFWLIAQFAPLTMLLLRADHPIVVAATTPLFIAASFMVRHNIKAIGDPLCERLLDGADTPRREDAHE